MANEVHTNNEQAAEKHKTQHYGSFSQLMEASTSKTETQHERLKNVSTGLREEHTCKI